jgi:3-hydroxy-9,10-secoandrosta-1,3,5(10)-triene-9,17-dione monooxygenase
MDIAQVIVEARDAIRYRISVHGSVGFAESYPLQRIWRDSEMAGRHAGCNPAIAALVTAATCFGPVPFKGE